MAAHPDDPPISPLRGIARILISADNFRRLLAIAPSPVNGITFCQANFRTMSKNNYDSAREFCEQLKFFAFGYMIGIMGVLNIANDSIQAYELTSFNKGLN